VLFSAFEDLSRRGLSGGEEHPQSGNRPQRRHRSSRTQRARAKQTKSRTPIAGHKA
jgi:hypothetical protein